MASKSASDLQNCENSQKKVTLNFSLGVDEPTPFQRPKVTAASGPANMIPHDASWFSSKLHKATFGVMEGFSDTSGLSALAQLPTFSWVPQGCSLEWLHSLYCTTLYAGPTCRLRFTCVIPNIQRPPSSQIPAEMHQPKVLHPFLLDQLQVQDQLLSAVFMGS